MTIPTHVPDANLTVGIANDGTATFTGPYDGSVATVVVADVKACNGNIVHVLDTVLQQGPDAPPKPVVQDGSDGACQIVLPALNIVFQGLNYLVNKVCLLGLALNRATQNVGSV